MDAKKVCMIGQFAEILAGDERIFRRGVLTGLGRESLLWISRKAPRDLASDMAFGREPDEAERRRMRTFLRVSGEELSRVGLYGLSYWAFALAASMAGTESERRPLLERAISEGAALGEPQAIQDVGALFKGTLLTQSERDAIATGRALALALLRDPGTGNRPIGMPLSSDGGAATGQSEHEVLGKAIIALLRGRVRLSEQLTRRLARRGKSESVRVTALWIESIRGQTRAPIDAWAFGSPVLVTVFPYEAPLDNEWAGIVRAYLEGERGKDDAIAGLSGRGANPDAARNLLGYARRAPAGFDRPGGGSSVTEVPGGRALGFRPRLG